MKVFRCRYAAVLLPALLLFGGCAKKDPVAARVGGREIYVKEVNEMVGRYAALSHRTDSGYQLPAGQALADMRRNFLEGLIDKITVLDRAAQWGMVVGEDELSVKIQQLRRGNLVIEDSLFDRFLAEQGMTPDLFRKNIRELMLMEKVRDSLLSGIEIPEIEMKAYYDANPERYKREKMKAAHLLLKSKEPNEKLLHLADSLAKRARAGDDFSALARKYSQDPLAKFGGVLGVFSKGDMVAQFDSAAFLLKKDEIAGPVKSVFGYHVIKALSDPRGETLEYKDVMNDINGLLLVKKRKERLSSLREGVKIDHLWDGKD